MRRKEITSSLFWMGVGLILTIWSLTYPLGSLAQPGSGFLPLGLGILLLIFSAVLLLRALRQTAPAEEKLRMLPARWVNLALTVMVLVAAVFLFEKVGYLLIFFAIALVLPLLAGQITFGRSLIFAVLSAVGVYVIFVWLLKQPLPTGFLGR
jgi:putative tricarboxylic transport membrane protein